MFERIKNITLDYENGIVLVNGKKPPFPIRVTLIQEDGWNPCKLMNYEQEKMSEEAIEKGDTDIADVVIDVSKITSIESQKRQRLVIRSEIERALQTLQSKK